MKKVRYFSSDGRGALDAGKNDAGIMDDLVVEMMEWLNGKDSDRFFDLDVFVWCFIMNDMNNMTRKTSLFEVLYFIFMFSCCAKEKKNKRKEDLHKN